MKTKLIVLALSVAALIAQDPQLAPSDLEVAQRKILVLMQQNAKIRQKAAELTKELGGCQAAAAKFDLDALPARAVDLDNAILGAHGATGGQVVWDTDTPHILPPKVAEPKKK